MLVPEPSPFLKCKRTYHIGSSIRSGEDISCIGRGHHKVWDDRNRFDLFGPLELLVMTNAQGWFWGLFSGIDTTGGSGQNLTERDFFSSNIFGFEFIQVCSNKTSK